MLLHLSREYETALPYNFDTLRPQSFLGAHVGSPLQSKILWARVGFYLSCPSRVWWNSPVRKHFTKFDAIGVEAPFASQKEDGRAPGNAPFNLTSILGSLEEKEGVDVGVGPNEIF